MKIEYKVTELTHEDIVDFLSLECGGWDYWGVIEPPKSIYEMTKKAIQESEEWQDREICYEDILATMLINGNVLPIKDVEEDDTYFLTLDSLKSGIAKNMSERPWDPSIESGDAITGDCIMQYALFDKIMYN